MFYLTYMNLTDWVEEISVDYVVVGSPVGVGTMPKESITPVRPYFNGLRIRVEGVFPATNMDELRSQITGIHRVFYHPYVRAYVSFHPPGDPDRRIAYVSHVSLQIPRWEGGALPVRFSWDIVTGLPWSYRMVGYYPLNLPTQNNIPALSTFAAGGDLYTPFRFVMTVSQEGVYHFSLEASAPRGIGRQTIRWKGTIVPEDPLLIRGACLDLPVYIGPLAGETSNFPQPSGTTGIDGLISGSPPYLNENETTISFTIHEGDISRIQSAVISWWPRHFTL